MWAHFPEQRLVIEPTRHIEREKGSLPVVVRRSKTLLLKLLNYGPMSFD